MTIHFHKYQGTGNDFVMVDNRLLKWEPTPEEVAQICHRRFGVGADGLILICDHEEYDFEMIYFNADGSQSLCGNGSRCAIHFAHHLSIIEETTSFLTTDGVHTGQVEKDLVSFQLYDVNNIETHGEDYFVNNGSPHYIRFVDNISNLDVKADGQQLRYDERFQPEGTNVNFVELRDSGISVRTYERGVEDETLSCGTGVSAAALAATMKGMESPVTINTLGGQLTVSFTREGDGFGNLFLKGPATPVFEGTFNL